jgi:hypothetical protein
MANTISICGDLIDQMLGLIESRSEVLLRNDPTFVQGLDEPKIRRQIPRGQAAIRAFLTDLKVGGNSNILHAHAAKLGESSLANQVIPVLKKEIIKAVGAPAPTLKAIEESKLGSVVASMSQRMLDMQKAIEAIATREGPQTPTIDSESITKAVLSGLSKVQPASAAVDAASYASIVQKTMDRTTTQRQQKAAAALKKNKEAQLASAKAKALSEGKEFLSKAERRKVHAQKQHEAAVIRHDRRKAHHERMVAAKAASKEKEAKQKVSSTQPPKASKTAEKRKFIYRSPAAKLKFREELISSGKVYYTAEQRRDYQARRKAEDAARKKKSLLEQETKKPEE